MIFEAVSAVAAGHFGFVDCGVETSTAQPGLKISRFARNDRERRGLLVISSEARNLETATTA